MALQDATPSQQRASQQKLAEGQRSFKAGKLEQAAQSFEAACAIVRHPEARLMLARSYQNMGELLKANAAYKEAVADAEAAAKNDARHRETLRTAQRELAELEGVLAKLTIQLRHAPEGTSVTIDGEQVPVEKLAQAILLQPGQVNVVAVTSDGREVSRTITLNAGQDAKVDLAFVKAEPKPVEAKPLAATSSGRANVGAFVAGGVGLAGLAAFGVFGSMSNARYADLQAECSSANRCAADQQDDIDAGKRYQTLANVGLAVGLVGLGASAALFVLGGSSSTTSATAAGVELGIGPGSVKLCGRFQ